MTQDFDGEYELTYVYLLVVRILLFLHKQTYCDF